MIKIIPSWHPVFVHCILLLGADYVVSACRFMQKTFKPEDKKCKVATYLNRLRAVREIMDHSCGVKHRRAFNQRHLGGLSW